MNAQASQEYAEAQLGEETKDVKVLAFWSHDHGVIHCRNKIETLADLQGQKLRFPTRLAGEALKAVGVAAIGMPVPQVPESLAQGVLDGAVVPWEVVPAIKLHELVKFHTEIPGTPTFYTATFFVVMNKAKYEGLPDDARKVIDETTGMALATEAGKMWDQAGADVRKMVEGKGNTILTLERDRQGRLDDGVRERDRSLGGGDEGQEYRRPRADGVGQEPACQIRERLTAFFPLGPAGPRPAGSSLT